MALANYQLGVGEAGMGWRRQVAGMTNGAGMPLISTSHEINWINSVGDHEIRNPGLAINAPFKSNKRQEYV